MSNEGINEYRRLEELGGSDYEIAEGEPNIKGWKIKDNLDGKLGKVDELLFNPLSRKVRYLIAELDKDVFAWDKDRKVIIPIGLAELHESEDDVYLPGLTIEQLANAPVYIKDSFNFDDEIAVRNAFGTYTETPGVYDEQTFYEHDHYNQRNLYGRRFPKKDFIE